MIVEKLIEGATESQVRTAHVVRAALREWTHSFPAEQLNAAIAELESKRREIDEQLEIFRSALEAMEDLKAKTNGDAHHRPPTKREAVLALLGKSPDREFKLSEIRAELVEQGVMADTDRASHALQMTLQNMLNRYREVERPRPGFYKIPRDRADRNGATNGQSRGDDAPP